MSEDEKKVYRMSEVDPADETKRFPTGVLGLDACLAESDDSPQGCPLGISVLLVGMPGGGKSTLALVIADAAASAGEDGEDHAVLIVSGEERIPRVKARWNRLKLGQKGADPFITRTRDAEEIGQMLLDIQPRVLVVDSVQTLSMGGSRKYEAQLEAVEYLERMCVDMGSTAIFVNHVSKTGKDHAGSQELAHLVDLHLHVTVNAKKGERALEFRKNRFGRAGFQVPVSIGQSSITVGTPAPISGDGSLVTARNALERAAEVAYDNLQKGEELTAYDFDKVTPPVSGNLWRTALELASKRLVRDGYEVDVYKVKGRNTWKVTGKKEPDPSAPPELGPVGADPMTIEMAGGEKVTFDPDVGPLIDMAPSKPELLEKDEHVPEHMKPSPIELD